MSQTLEIFGKTYQNVNKIYAKDENGIEHAFTEGSAAPQEKQINFIDYDGTLLYSYTKSEIEAMTQESDLPANPSHEGLVAQGWNWTLAQIKAQLTAIPNGDVWIGQMYVTESGATEIDVEMPDGRLSPILTIAVNGTVTVDWGDDTTADTVTGTSLTTRTSASHTYANAGNYTISIKETSSGQYTFYCSTSYLLLRKNTSSNENKIYASCIKRIRLGTGITKISNYSFYYCKSLINITIPNTVISIGQNAFYACGFETITIPSGITSIEASAISYCYSLKNIAIPSTITSINGSAFYNSYSLENITIPSGITSIGNYVFYYCTNLKNITISCDIGSNTFANCYSLLSATIRNGVEDIGDSAFYSCHGLKKIILPSGIINIKGSAFAGCHCLGNITIPSSVTNINTGAFSNCYGVKEYHILATNIPTLGSSVFSGISSDCVIYVPQGMLNDYQTATGWSDYASYMQEEST